MTVLRCKKNHDRKYYVDLGKYGVAPYCSKCRIIKESPGMRLMIEHGWLYYVEEQEDA